MYYSVCKLNKTVNSVMNKWKWIFFFDYCDHKNMILKIDNKKSGLLFEKIFEKLDEEDNNRI